MEVESTGLTGKKIRFNTVDKKKVEADTSFFTSYLMVQKIPASCKAPFIQKWPILFFLAGDLEIPIEFSSASLLKAIEYLKYHKNQQRVLFIKPLPDRDYFYNTVDSWDKNFIESLNLEELLELIQVADKLNIETLSDFCAAYVANYFKGRQKFPLKVISSQTGLGKKYARNTAWKKS